MREAYVFVPPIENKGISAVDWPYIEGVVINDEEDSTSEERGVRVSRNKDQKTSGLSYIPVQEVDDLLLRANTEGSQTLKGSIDLLIGGGEAPTLLEQVSKATGQRLTLYKGI